LTTFILGQAKDTRQGRCLAPRTMALAGIRQTVTPPTAQHPELLTREREHPWRWTHPIENASEFVSRRLVYNTSCQTIPNFQRARRFQGFRP